MAKKPDRTKVAEIVVASGENARDFPPGTEVVRHLRSGAHATYITVPVAAIAQKPKTLTWEAAGGLFLAGATALDTLDALKIGADDTVVISAAAGGVGSIEAQLAKHRGSTVVGTCGERNFDYLRQLGIKPVRYGEGITDRIRRAARWPGDRLDRQLRTGWQRPRGGAGRARRPLQVER